MYCGWRDPSIEAGGDRGPAGGVNLAPSQQRQNRAAGDQRLSENVEPNRSGVAPSQQISPGVAVKMVGDELGFSGEPGDAVHGEGKSVHFGVEGDDEGPGAAPAERHSAGRWGRSRP